METESAGFAPSLHFGSYAAFGVVETSFMLDLITRYSSLISQLFLVDLDQIKQKAKGDCIKSPASWFFFQSFSGDISNVLQCLYGL